MEQHASVQWPVAALPMSWVEVNGRHGFYMSLEIWLHLEDKLKRGWGGV